MEYNYQLNFSGYNLKSYSSSCMYKFEHLFPELHVPRTLAREVEKLPFTYNSNDLLRLGQSDDFRDLKLTEPLQAFYKYMKTDVRKFVENQYRIRTSEKITMTASKYHKGDFLLCHDDNCGDRCIAFVYYLTEDWSLTSGGSLRFFGHSNGMMCPMPSCYTDVILPTFNSLVLFQVSNLSHHEVQEVLEDKCRLSVNGWFHCDMADCPSPIPNWFIRSPLIRFPIRPPAEITVAVERDVNPLYLTQETMDQMFNMFQEKTELVLPDFLNEEFYTSVLSELQYDRNDWNSVGPSNYRKADGLHIGTRGCSVYVIKHNMPNTNILLNLLISDYWLNFVTNITDTCLAVFRGCLPPVCMVEVRRWREGDYTLLADHEVSSKYKTLEVTLFFGVDEALIGSDEKDEYGRPFLSGKLVRTVVADIGKNLDEVVLPAKMLRLGEHRSFHQKRRQNHAKTRNKLKTWNRPYSALESFLSKAKNPAAVEPMRPHVLEKIKKMKDYRKRHPPKRGDIEPLFILPENNSLLISLNSDRTQTFLGYIQKQSGKQFPQTCFYSVTVTYLLNNNENTAPIESGAPDLLDVLPVF